MLDEVKSGLTLVTNAPVLLTSIVIPEKKTNTARYSPVGTFWLYRVSCVDYCIKRRARDMLADGHRGDEDIPRAGRRRPAG